MTWSRSAGAIHGVSPNFSSSALNFFLRFNSSQALLGFHLMTVAACSTSSSLPSSVGALLSEHSLALAFGFGNPAGNINSSAAVGVSGTVIFLVTPLPRLLRRGAGDVTGTGTGDDSAFEIEVVEVTCAD